jgi:hypothetical protein
MTATAILADAGALLTELAGLGIHETASEYDPAHFGNYYVDLTGPHGDFRITRDRGQYLLDGDLERLKDLGLFRAFAQMSQFRDAVLKYVGAPAA